MALFVLLAAAIGLCTAELRHVEFSNGTRSWVDHRDLPSFVKPGQLVSFIDITHRENGPAFRNLRASPSYPSKPTHQTEINLMTQDIEPQDINSTISSLSNYFNRYYTTQDAADAVSWLLSQYKAAAAGRDGVTFELFEHEWTQPSLIVTVEGSGNLADQIVVLGGHIDSIASGGATGRAPGADDDASGSSTVLEVFRTLMKASFQPSRTVQFMAFSAEEVGLRGSQDIAESYAKEERNVYSMMQFDMTGYPAGEGAKPQPIGLIRDFVDDGLTAFVAQLLDTYTTIGYANSTCNYACSDHASFTRADFPSAFPFETTFDGSNPHIHTTDDTTAYISLERLRQFAVLGTSYVVELAS